MARHCGRPQAGILHGLSTTERSPVTYDLGGFDKTKNNQFEHLRPSDEGAIPDPTPHRSKDNAFVLLLPDPASDKTTEPA